jgi:hypothetical protein
MKRMPFRLPESSEAEFEKMSIEQQVGHQFAIAMMHSCLRNLPLDTQLDIVMAGIDALRVAGWISFVNAIAAPGEAATIKKLQQVTREAVENFEPTLDRFSVLCQLLDDQAAR